MELNDTHKFAAPPSAVWAALHNDTALQQAIPGARQVTWQGESAIAVEITVGIGPINGSASLQAQVVEQTAPTHLNVMLHHRGPDNTVHGALTVDLAPDGAGTLLSYHGTAQIAGPLALADNPVVRPLVQVAVNQFFSSFEKQVR